MDNVIPSSCPRCGGALDFKLEHVFQNKVINCENCGVQVPLSQSTNQTEQLEDEQN